MSLGAALESTFARKLSPTVSFGHRGKVPVRDHPRYWGQGSVMQTWEISGFWVAVGWVEPRFGLGTSAKFKIRTQFRSLPPLHETNLPDPTPMMFPLMILLPPKGGAVSSIIRRSDFHPLGGYPWLMLLTETAQ